MIEPTARNGSRSTLLAVEDTEFLLRDEMRAIRFALEYGKAELALRDWGIRSTIIVFGGGRVPSPEQADAAVAAARTEAEKQARKPSPHEARMARDECLAALPERGVDHPVHHVFQGALPFCQYSSSRHSSR